MIFNFLVDDTAHPGTGNIVERAAEDITGENTNNDTDVEPTTRVFVVI